ncbi:hypothetical protein SBRCBS47491_004263 [Sporothrix bragantina]|uniref:Xylanolytic transcriptional activator regulatory domain-containing protein n=1 Tax=Sporothrix bragantina TaxID=671064 RepID=A0ABP0BLZ9_9PEZI
MADTTTEPTGVEPWWQNDRFSALDTPQSSDLGQPTLLASECSSNSGLTDWVPQFNIADWMAWDWDWMNTGLPLNREGWDNMLHDTPGRYDGHAHNAMAIEPMSMPPVSGTITSSTNMAFTEMPMSIEHPHLNGLGPGLPFEQPPPTVQKDRSHSWKRAPTAGAMFFTFSRVSAEDMDILVSENSGHVASLFDEAYRKMAEGVRNACSGNGNGNGNGNDSDSGSGSGSGAHFIPERAEFDSFPSRQVLDAFIQLYFEYFQHLFPLVHQPTFHSARTHWILVLAVASIGCRYSKASLSSSYAYALSQLLRICISYTIQVDKTSIRASWLTIAMMLNQISMMYSGDRRLLEMGLATGNSTESPPASLAAVLGGLLDGRQVLHHVGNFGRLAIVHAIYQTTFDVRAQTANPLLDVLLEEILSATAAASTATATSAMNGRGMALLQSQHSPSSWRLETSVIASAYHVSLVSIVPVSDLLAFVSSTATTAEKTAAEAELRAWMADNGGRTARRAAVRACITFTLIRERPCHGFYEPVALLMSTLTLWVFNRLSTLLLSSVTNSGTSGNAASSSSAQVTLRLDQAWTAESERAWLEAKNENVRGYLTDVGNIKDAKFRRKLLEVACNALSAMPAWGLSHGFADFLSLLKEAA